RLQFLGHEGRSLGQRWLGVVRDAGPVGAVGSAGADRLAGPRWAAVSTGGSAVGSRGALAAGVPAGWAAAWGTPFGLDGSAVATAAAVDQGGVSRSFRS